MVSGVKEMNFEELGENLGLEKEEISELFWIFMETSFLDLKRVRTGIEMEDLQKVMAGAHSIRGAAANLGLIEISEMATSIEMNAKERRLNGAKEMVETIKTRLDEIALGLLRFQKE
jgi:HPt (histidine-containing phosphotransfer) domain-containing protein